MRSLKFVPKCPTISEMSPKVGEFLSLMSRLERLLIVTGAGVSTESGIPDYRSAGVGLYARSSNRPITIQEYMANEESRRRYWARNFLAWPTFQSARCNETHLGLAQWENSNGFLWLITQNVDGLHSAAGSTKLTEMHGCARLVICLKCKTKYTREEIQNQLAEMNRGWRAAYVGEMAPDGDVEISTESVADFRPPYCPRCSDDQNAVLKTDVVFFGDNVDRRVDDICKQRLVECDGLLVLGSSLSVMSSYRIAYAASLKCVPIAIVNIGPARVDDMATIKLEAKCTDIMKVLKEGGIIGRGE